MERITFFIKFSIKNPLDNLCVFYLCTVYNNVLFWKYPKIMIIKLYHGPTCEYYIDLTTGDLLFKTPTKVKHTSEWNDFINTWIITVYIYNVIFSFYAKSHFQGNDFVSNFIESLSYFL